MYRRRRDRAAPGSRGHPGPARADRLCPRCAPGHQARALTDVGCAGEPGLELIGLKDHRHAVVQLHNWFASVTIIAQDLDLPAQQQAIAGFRYAPVDQSPIAVGNAGTDLEEGQSGAAESLAHPFVRLRWIHVAHEESLVFERCCEQQQKLLEGAEVFTLHRRLDHGLNTMIARYERRIDGEHPDARSVRMIRLLRKARAPAPSPCLKRLLINEQAPKGSFRIRTIRRVTQPPERHCEVNLVGRKQAEEFAGKLQIAICLG
jgi:hypothetical protein